MSTSLKQVSINREESIWMNEIDNRIDLLLSNYQAVTANPRSMGYLRFLLKHYAKDPHPWRACFHPDTPVDMPRDHEKYPDGVPISKVKSGDLVWSFNSDLHVFELKEVKWSDCIRKNAQLCLLTLDSGKTIKATKDHQFMKRDGAWAQLQDLRVGESLMPFYRDYLPMVRLSPDRNQWVTEHEHVVQMRDGKDARKGKHIHHYDERRINTSPRNLELLSSSEHAAKHHETIREKIICKEEMRKCRYCKNLFIPKYKNHLTCGECPESCGYIKQKVGKEISCVFCDEKFIVVVANQEFCSVECRKNQYKIEGVRRISFPCNSCGKIVNTRKSKQNEVYCLNCKRIINFKPKQIEIRICKNCGSEFEKKYKNHMHCTKKCRDLYAKRAYSERNPGTAISFNHKVISIDILDEYSDVWDIEVSDNHSFVVQGVVVHNCYRDNLKRFGEKTPALCGVLKDVIRQRTNWRGHPTTDVGSPGVGIGESDKGAASPWGGHKHLSEDSFDMGLMAMPEDVALILEDLSEKCDVYRVLIGLDEPPHSDLVLL